LLQESDSGRPAATGKERPASLSILGKMEGWLELREQIATLLPMVGGAIGGALLLYLLVTALTACSVPGVLIPMSLTGGVLLGPWITVAAVAGGALSGSLLLFQLTKRLGGQRLRLRLGPRLQPFEARLATYGPLAVFALRVAGLPGPLITAGAAATAMRLPVFAGATLLGLLPSVVLAAAGSSFLAG
jgi:uncharacterized membrane protein YdjX (TVP38/TMEM64 family)